MPLLVYKSSAGSGKTSTLVNEYLKITLKNPQVFRNVLAITFTNKAANEMKERILNALVKLSQGEGKKYGELKNLGSEIGLDEKEISNRAEKLLSLILHRYDEFAVSTIDSFVHRIVRTFSTDVKLPQNFEVVIDNEEIVPEIIEKLYEKVNPGNDFTGLMVDFVMKQVDDEKNHDPTIMLKEFIEKQLNEESHYHLKKIENLDVNDFLKIIDKLIFLLKQKKQKLQTIGSDALNLIEQNGLTSSEFYQGSNGIFNYFKKLLEFRNVDATKVGSNVEKTINEDNWYSGKASTSDKRMIDVIKGDLVMLFNDSREIAHHYWLYRFLFDKIHQLALMREIRSLFSEYTDQTQRVHISEFNKKINDQISGQPVPFIYERLGRRYQHFLIDEFQDTSMLQWQNLLPLLDESLASNNLNMLVGDTKQAIYRFRNGEVELFSNLPKIYRNDGSQLMKDREKVLEMSFTEKPLSVNYRSREEIIHFNNAFFESMKSSVRPWLQLIYKEHGQEIPKGNEKKGGYVSIELIHAESTGEYRETRLIQVQNYVESLLQAGNSRKDICVLSRSNSNSSEIATFLLEKGHKVISPESLLLTNSAKVRLIVALMNLISDSKQILFLADFIYNLLLIRNKTSEFHTVFSKIKKTWFFDLNILLAAFQIDLKSSDFSGLSVFESVELIIRKLRLNHEKDVFLLYFLDFVYENQEKGMGSMDVFLEFWDSKKNKTSVITPTEEDAVSVMTIHKAKGLKFNNVIVDITEGGTKKGKTEFWTSLNSSEFEELEIGLLPIKKDIEKAGFAEVYIEEENKTYLDFINMVYVSFTRAVNSLFIVSHKNEKHKNKLTDLLISFLKGKGIWNEEKLNYEFGVLSSTESRHVSKGKERVDCEEFLSSDWKKLVTIANSEEVMWELLDEMPAKSFGKLIHQMMANIYTQHDVEFVVQSYLHSGIIDIDESIEIQKILYEIVNHTGLISFFENKYISKNECSIIDKHGKLLRPDRVVISEDSLHIIDYKTGKKLPGHLVQINEYGDAFASLGYKKISKVLVYVNESVELVEV